MRLIWPEFLWCFVLTLLLLPVAYVWILRRKQRVALSFSSISVMRQAQGPWGVWRRHVPPVLLWLGLLLATFGLTRPTAQVTLPADYMTLILAIDVSRSMLAEDVEPNRMKAAQATVNGFLQELPRNIRVGIVTFAGTAQLVQQVTDNREDLIEAVDRIQVQRGTATGSGLLLALATLLPDSGVNVQSAIYGNDFARRNIGGEGGSVQRTAVPSGSYANGAIILVSDGRRTHGPDPLAAAKQAAERGVRVYTVAFGTPYGFIPGWDGNNFFTQVDERSLQAVAAITEAEFFRAEDSKTLDQVYKHLSSKFSLERRHTEVTALFAMASALFIVLAAVLSLIWFRRAT